jgi:hypothetical protein
MSGQVLHVYYDTRFAPITFDFATFLVVADAARQISNCSRIAIHIHRSNFRNKTLREVAYSEDVKLWRFKKIILGVTNLLPTIESVEWSSSAPARLEYPYFPPSYPPRNSNEEADSIPYLYKYLLLIRKKNETLNFRPFLSSELGREYVKSIFANDARKLITITLRTSNQQIERNSNIKVWHSVYCELKSAGYRCVVVPDFEDIIEAKLFDSVNWEIFLPAVFDQEIRLSLYSLAHLNLCVLNGVMVPLFHSPYPYSVFKPLVPQIHQTTEEWLKNQFGVSKDENFWWSTDRQHLNWIDDSSPERILSVLERQLR